jgi:hypothetical protein
MRNRIRKGLRGAAYDATVRARRFMHAAPRSLEAVDRTDANSMLLWLARDGGNRAYWRPSYVWPILRSAVTAKAIGMDRVSVIEFGVAGGNGLLGMEAAAAATESLVGVGVEVFGFDTGSGLPRPVDHRDAPHFIGEGDFAMDVEKLRARLGDAQLVLGLVRETVPRFLSEQHPPVGFISFDLDYYSSTMEAFAILEARAERLLPRLFCYFDDVMWPPWTDFNGERAAIRDFNAAHESRKVSRVHGLRYSLPPPERRAQWAEKMYIAEIFDHELFSEPERARLPDTGLRSL